jgi:hypothetical protein
MTTEHLAIIVPWGGRVPDGSDENHGWGQEHAEHDQVQVADAAQDHISREEKHSTRGKSNDEPAVTVVRPCGTGTSRAPLSRR